MRDTLEFLETVLERAPAARALISRGLVPQPVDDAPGTYVIVVYEAPNGEPLVPVAELALERRVIYEVPVGSEERVEFPAIVLDNISVEPYMQGQRIGTLLYQLSAEVACMLGLPLASDSVRSPLAEAFWRKQVRKGRARPLRTPRLYGKLADRPMRDVVAYLNEVLWDEAVMNGEPDPDAVVDAAIDQWLQRWPKPDADTVWEVHRYILEDPCRHRDDLGHFQ